MKRTNLTFILLLTLAISAAACAPTPTPVPPTPVPTQVPPTLPPAPTPVPPTATSAPTQAPTVAPTSAPGVPAASVEKLVNDKFNTADTKLALWAIQPGLGTVMIEYSQRLARLWFAANAGNWDMAKYQLDEMIEIQETGETTRPARAPMLKAFEDNYLAKLDKAIGAKDKAAFTTAFNDTVAGCNGCHKASSGTTWKSYQFVSIQTPKTDPAYYLDWKGAGQGNRLAHPPAAATTAPTPTLTGTLDAAGVEKLLTGKFNNYDSNLALWRIQPALGTVMIEYGNRFSRAWYAAHNGNWDMAKYQLDEMPEIQEVAEVTRPGRADALKAFEHGFLDPLNQATQKKDLVAFEAAYQNAVTGCNGCHAAAKGGPWSSYQFIKVQVPTADNSDYIVWKADKGTGNYIVNPPAVPTTTPKPALTGTLDMAGVEKLVNDKFNNLDTNLTLWKIQPGLGTVMIEYGRRFAQIKYALDAGNWDMAKYQLDEALEIQEVGETTRPARAPMLKAFEDNYAKPLDAAIMAKDKDKANAALKNALTGCNACHTASKSANWASYGYIQVQLPQSDPGDYQQWNAPVGTGNYVSAPAGGQPTAAATKAAGTPPQIPVSHASPARTQCLVCHLTGVSGAPKAPTANPDHSAFKDDPAVCQSCHTQAK
jgi:cytochrome c553